MGAFGIWLFGEEETLKRKVLIEEVAKLYKVNVEEAEKGFVKLEEELKKTHLSEQTKD